MKKIVLFLSVLCICISNIYSQQQSGLSELGINSLYDGDIPPNICKDGRLGILVFYSAIKNLQFEAISPSTGGNTIANIVNIDYKSSDNCYILCVQPQKETNFSVKISGNKFYPKTYVVGSLGAKEMKFFTIFAKDNTAEITVLDKDGKALDNALLEIKGKPVERTNSDGFRKIELSSSESATLFVSHGLYYDIKAINVRPGDRIKVQLEQPKIVIVDPPPPPPVLREQKKCYKWHLGFGVSNIIVFGYSAYYGGKLDFGYYINPKNLLSFETCGGNDDYGDYISMALASWSYIVNLSENFQWRIGPSLGILNIDETTDEFAFGGNTGIIWNFSKNKRWFFDLGYRLFGTSSDAGSHINLSVCWRF